MMTGGGNSVWSEKGATFSDKTARKEFGLTQEEIFQAINEGKLQFIENSLYGNPFFRLIRTEVEALVGQKFGSGYLKEKKLKKELTQVNKELRTLKTQVASLELKKAELLAASDEIKRQNEKA